MAFYAVNSANTISSFNGSQSLIFGQEDALSIVPLVFTLLDLFLKVQKALNKLLRSRRAPWYENINREEFCRVLDDVIGIVERPA